MAICSACTRSTIPSSMILTRSNAAAAARSRRLSAGRRSRLRYHVVMSSDLDPVRSFLRQRGCPEEVVAAGLEGLIDEWERVVEQVSRIYPLGLDDYLNDLDGRQLLQESLGLLAGPASERARDRVRVADAR